VSNLVRAEKMPKTAATDTARQESELRRSVRLLSRFLVGQRRQFVMAFLLLIAEAWSATRVPLVLGYLIDYLTQRIAVLNNANAARLPLSPLQMFGLNSIVNPDFDTIAIVTIGVVLLTLFNSATDSFAEIYLANGGRLLGYNLRVGLYAHLQKLSLAFFGKQRTGDLLTRVTGDISAIEEFVIKSLSDIVGSILLIGFILYTMIVGAWQVAVIAALIIPFMALVSNYFAQRIKDASKKQRSREGELASAAQEMLTSIRVIQTYGSGGDEAKRFADTSRKAMDTMLQAAKLQATFSATVSTLESVAVALVIWLAVYLIFGSVGLGGGFGSVSLGFTIGTLTVFTKYIADMFKPTKKIIKEWNTFGKIYASVERIGDLMDRKPAVDNAPNAIQAPRFQGNVAFNHVSFAYMPDAEDMQEGQAQPKLALRDVSFSIAPSEVVALVGGSGAGKSTIVQLLPRLYDPHSGAITIDGQDIRHYTLDSLRGQMSMVLQEAILFTGTVADNIAYGRPGATREEIVAAAMQANAHDFIEQLPKGYDTELSERASNLSGGQRQRIAIARAFIRNTSLLILDEPTTGLDADSTELVLLALRELMRGKATLIISHDLNLIRQADKIIAIKDGQIVQVGTHKELLKQGGLYADLYNKQFGYAVEEQGAKIKPIEVPPPQVVEDDEDVPVESPKIFQTLIGHALPAPATPKAFQTLMMLGVVPPSQSSPLPPAAKPVAAPAASPAKPAVASPPAPAQAAPTAKPAVPPPAPVVPPKPAIQAQSPAPAQPKPVTPAPAGANHAEKPKPAIFETTIMRTIPEGGTTTARTEQKRQKPADGGSGGASSLADLTYTKEMRAIEAEHRVQGSATANAGRSGLRSERLDMLNSPVIQSDLPGLRAAFDTEAMRQHMQSLLFGKTRPYHTVERCELEQATYLPGEGVAIRYQTQVTDRSSGQTIAPIIVGMVFPSQLACALYMRDKLAPLVELMRGRPEVEPFAVPAAVVEPLNMTLHVFPIDGELPALIGATNAPHMRAVLSETLPQAIDNTFTMTKCEVELVDYARRERAVLRYQLEGKRAGNGRVERQTVYGKVFTNNTGALAGPITAALREHVLHHSNDYVFNVPRVLGWRPDLHLSLLETIPGKPMLSEVLKARFKGQTTEPELLSLREMVDACARIAATLHTSKIKLGRRLTLDDQVAALRTGFADLRRIAPDLGTQLDAWLDQVTTYAEQSDALNLCFCHGDYTYTQVIFEGRQAGLVDFDSVCQAEPALDLGHFLSYLKIAGFKAQQVAGSDSRALVSELSDRFMSTYLSTMGGRVEDAERLRVRVAVYQMLSLLRRALRSWQKFKGGRLENALALLEEEIDYLPQLDY
jgi:ABC-type multidrug transport system fused ATPase/permease subunit/thiamine kinase-like enzyme